MRYPAARDARLLELVAADVPNTTIARTLGTSEATVRRWRQRLAPPPADDAALWTARRDAAVAEVQARTDAYDWLQPVALPAPPPPRAKIASTPRTIIAGDFHWPCQSDEAESILLQTIAALRPARFILNGDGPDLLAVSKYPKDARRGHTWPLRDEVTAMHGFLHRLHAIGDAWGMEVIETESNHAGNGTAGRWWRYLSDRCPELLGHAQAADLLSYPAWFYPSWSSIHLAEEVVLADDLLVLHGDIVRKHGAYSARAHADKWQASVLHNHTHRVGSSMLRIPAVPGLRETDGLVRAYENGCMCGLSPSYASAANWTNSFAIVTHHADGASRYGVEQVIVSRGRAVVGALGGELAA